MSFKVGDFISVKTKTFNDVFGQVVYQYKGMTKMDDGSERCCFEIVSGTGPAARIGYIVYDTKESMEKHIKNGIAKIVDSNVVKTVPKNIGVIEYD